MFLLSLMDEMWPVKTDSGGYSYPTVDLGLKKENRILPSILYALRISPIVTPFRA